MEALLKANTRGVLVGIPVYCTHQTESERGRRVSQLVKTHVFARYWLFSVCGSQLFPKLVGEALGGQQVT